MMAAIPASVDTVPVIALESASAVTAAPPRTACKVWMTVHVDDGVAGTGATRKKPTVEMLPRQPDSRYRESRVETSVLREKAQKLIDKRGLRKAAGDIGVSSDALARFVAGGLSHPGTVKLIEEGLERR